MNPMKLQKLRDLPIEGVAERLGIRVSHHKSLCPFHNDTNPSLSFNVRKNNCHCFVCGTTYGPIDLVMNYLHVDFLEACRWLADNNNIILEEYRAKPVQAEAPKPFDATKYVRFFEHPYLNAAARRFLYEERLLDPHVVAACQLTSWQDRECTPWLQTPYFDVDGKLIGVQNRNLKKGASPRFRFPSGSRCSIYNLPVLRTLQPGDELYITEGCSDCWSILSAGHKAIAIPSATLLKPADRELLAKLDSSHNISFKMFPDADLPGERLFLQLREVLPNLEHRSLPFGCKDFSDYYVSAKKINNQIWI